MALLTALGPVVGVGVEGVECGNAQCAMRCIQTARTRTNTNPDGTEASAAKGIPRARVVRESKLEESRGAGGRSMRLMGGRSVGECWGGRHSCRVARSLK